MSMTALVSAFARAYHAGREGAKIFDDKYARLLLSTEEHEQIGAHMASGVSFFDPAFRGDAGDALRRVMDGYLSPTPLARAAFAAEELSRSGAAQVLSLAAGTPWAMTAVCQCSRRTSRRYWPTSRPGCAAPIL